MVLALGFFHASAQEKKTIAGTIADSSGSPVPAATIQEKGKKNFTTSDAHGRFSITVTPGAVLQITCIGFQSMEAPSDNPTPSITLINKAGGLGEVVVTALGIRKQKKSLGYAVQEIKGETLSDIKDPNLVNELSGQVAGLQVIGGGSGPTGSSQIRLRGNNSLTGPSQPLIVVDGVPIGDFLGRQGVGSTNDFYNPSLDMGNGLSDINPDDIATLTVLKGPAGAALYGSQGGNGVILITTKSGTKQPGAGINVSSSVGFENIFMNPKTQNDYGQGSNGLFVNSESTSWGPKITGQTVTQWNGVQSPLQSFNNAGNYFKGGVISTQNISYQQQYGNTSIYTSYSRLDDKSIIPGSKLARNNITARAVTKFGANNRWSLDTKIQFINATADNRPLEGVNTNNIFLNINTLPRSIDIRQFKNSVDSAGNMIWYAKGNQTNPYWASQFNPNTDTRNRFIMYGTLGYKFTDWLSAAVTGSADIWTTQGNSKLYAGSPANESGSYSMNTDNYYQTNYSTLITAHKDNIWSKFSGSASVGGNLEYYQDNQFSANAGTLRVPNLFSITNAVGNPSFNQQYASKAINSLYGTAEANWDNYLFLNATWRTDWSSALSEANRAFSYPSVNLSYVFTDHLKDLGGRSQWLSYGKIRAGYASAGSDLGPYELYNLYTIGLDANNNTTATPGSTLYNQNIRSQLIKSIELGAELRFFKDIVGVDFTWYKSNATNQIITLPLDPLSGYTGKIINAGNLQNEGIEITADAKIMTSNRNGFTWTTSFNFAENNNTLKSLYPGVNIYQLGGFDQISVNGVVGQRYGQIYGSRIDRVENPKDPNNGKMILSANGTPQANPNGDTLLGNQQARQIIGWTNRFSYKHFSLSVLLDASLGGKEFSYTLSSMETAGTSALTVTNHNRDSMVLAGVQVNGSGGYTANTTKISPQQYWTALGVGNTGITEANLFDASNIRIRNIQLAYALPRKYMAGTPFQKVQLALSCNNVWMISSHMHGLDPESSYATGTVATGFESGAAPTTRTYYITLSLGF